MARFTLSMFTPSEAEAITGLTTTMQRDWRRRGFIAESDGHARFDAFTLAEMLILKQLADNGVGPQAGRELAKLSAISIVWNALLYVDAYEGDHMRALDWNSGTPGAPQSWGDRADWLARSILRQNGHRVIPARYLIRWANGTERWDQSLDAAFNDFASFASEVTGPVLVLDLQAIGSLLLDRMPRAFVHVDLSDSLPTDGPQ